MKTTGYSLCLLLGFLSAVWGQDRPAKAPKATLNLRFGLDVNLIRYPQKTPQEAVQSAVKAIFDQRFDYLLAHIADPTYVDAKVEKYRLALPGKKEAATTRLAFQQLVKETTVFFFEDAERIAELGLFGKEAEWKIDEDSAVGSLKKLPGRQVFLSRMEDRWFLENRQKDE